VGVTMYRAQFAFDSREAGVLPCAVGDQFTVLDSSNEQWWLVQNGKGQVGYVPANYIVADDVRKINETIWCYQDILLPLRMLKCETKSNTLIVCLLYFFVQELNNYM